MEALQFFVYALIVFLLAMLLGGTMIGYYFAKKKEFEIGKIKAMAALVKGQKSGQISGTDLG